MTSNMDFVLTCDMDFCDRREAYNGHVVEVPGKEGAQELGKVVCINPGRLTKGSAGGTFVHLHVAAPAVEEGAEVAPAHERLRVEIVKV